MHPPRPKHARASEHKYMDRKAIEQGLVVVPFCPEPIGRCLAAKSAFVQYARPTDFRICFAWGSACGTIQFDVVQSISSAAFPDS